MLLVCTSPDMLSASLVFVGWDGGPSRMNRWTYTDERDDTYLSPCTLAGGGFSVLHKRVSAGGDVSEAALLLLDKNGNARPLFERLSNKGDSLLSCSYPYLRYSSWVFHKGAFADDSICT